jgi:hypothetical protein
MWRPRLGEGVGRKIFACKLDETLEVNGEKDSAGLSQNPHNIAYGSRLPAPAELCPG